MSLSECASGVKPFEGFNAATNASLNITADTAGEVCAKVVASSTREILFANEGLCSYRDSSGSPTVFITRAIRQVCVGQDVTSLTPTKVQDYMALWAAFLGAAVVILCAKALYSRFRVDHGER